MQILKSMAAALVFSALSLGVLPAQAALQPLVQVTSDTEPGSKFSLQLLTNSAGTIQKVQFFEGSALDMEFTVDQAKQGIVLLTEQGVAKVITLIVDSRFDANQGGRAVLRLMRKFAVLGSDFRDFPVQIRRENAKFVIYSDLPDGLKAFDSVYFEALRSGDPRPEADTLGAGSPSADAVGIKLLQLKLGARVIDTVNTAELRTR